MSISALSAAKRLAERSGWSLTNLQLQKLLYISHMFHLGRTGQPLIQGKFEAWDYGPVHPSIYHSVKVFGADPVGNIFHAIPDVPNGPDADVLDEVYNHLEDTDPAKLVAITHWDGGAWAKHYRPGVRGITIPNEDIHQEYNNRAK